MSILVKNRLSLVLTAFAVSSLSSQAAVNFEKQILPVLQKKCLDCHSATKVVDGKPKKPKGDLRLDAAWAMLKGAENGPSVVPSNLAKSYIHEVVNLPKDDDMFMPPKGDPMTAEEIKLLKEWIETGADFGGWTGNMEGAPAEALAAATASAPKPVKPREHDLFYAALAKDLKPAADADLAKAKQAGAQVSLLKADSPLLRADFLTGVSKCDDAKVASLTPLGSHISQLDLGRTVITDAALKTLSEFSRLSVLDLRQTKITDAGLAALSSLKNLQTLNLYGTEITDAGLKSLAAIKSLKQVTLFQTKATPAGVKLLTEAISGIQVTLK
jgi:Planctomycete cytochrome C/Leucine Rich repeat